MKLYSVLFNNTHFTMSRATILSLTAKGHKLRLNKHNQLILEKLA